MKSNSGNDARSCIDKDVISLPITTNTAGAWHLQLWTPTSGFIYIIRNAADLVTTSGSGTGTNISIPRVANMS